MQICMDMAVPVTEHMKIEGDQIRAVNADPSVIEIDNALPCQSFCFEELCEG